MKVLTDPHVWTPAFVVWERTVGTYQHLLSLPTLSAQWSASGTTALGSIVAYGTAGNTASLAVSDNGVSIAGGTPAAGGAFGLSLPLFAGTNVLVLTATSPTGDTATATATISYAAAPPTLTLTGQVRTGTTTNNATLTVAGLTDAGNTLTINGLAATVSGTGQFTRNVPQLAGPNTIVLLATSTLGATSAFQGSITYTPAPAATHFAVSAPSTAASGTSFSVTVTAQDASNATVPGYTGAVHFTSSDNAATLSADYTFTGADAGTHTFTITLRTASPPARTITATDTVSGSITGSASVTVNTPPATHFAASAPATATSGASFSVTLTAQDANNATVAGYAGTAHFTSSDGQAVLPADYTFIAADAGTHTFSVTLKTTGSQTFTATDTATSSLTGQATVTVATGGPCASAGLTVTPTGSASVGASLTLTGASTGCGGTPQYRFWQYKVATNAWTVLQDYSSTASYQLTTTGYSAGFYTFAVTVRSQGSVLEREKDAYVQNYQLTAPGSGPCPSAGLAIVPANSATVGTTLTLNASSTGCGGTPQYRFWQFKASTNTWTVLQDYSASATLSLPTTGYSAGSYTFAVTVRSQSSVLEREKDAYTPYPAVSA